MAGSSIGRTSDFGSESWRFEPSPASHCTTGLKTPDVSKDRGDPERIVAL